LELKRQQLSRPLTAEAGYYVDKLRELKTPLSEVVEEATKFVAQGRGVV